MHLRVLAAAILVSACASSEPNDGPNNGPNGGGGMCGGIGAPAPGTCVYGVGFVGEAIRGISCTSLSIKIDGTPVSLTFDRTRTGKSPAVFDNDGSLEQSSDTLDGCYIGFGPGGFGQLNFRDAAGVQRLTLDVGSYGDAVSNEDAKTHGERDGCMVHAYAWDDKGTYLGRFQTPAVDGEYPETDGTAMAMQSGTYSCTAGDANPLRIELHQVHLVDNDYRHVGLHTLDLDGVIEIHRK